MTAQRVDVLIAGGGMVGASLAYALSSLSLSVMVVEAAPPRAAAGPGYDDRSTALAWGSRRIFETLGLWSALRGAATPIHHIHVSDRGRFGVTRLSHTDQDVDALGYVVENRRLGQVLSGALGDSGARVCCPGRITAVETGSEFVQVAVDAGEGKFCCEARLLVIADGAHSKTRALAAIEHQVTDYEQTALIANVTPEQPHRNVAYERFTDGGPLAVLPLSNGRCSVVWTLNRADGEKVNALDDAAFMAALQQAFGFRLGRLLRVGNRHSYPLSLVRASPIAAARKVVIGNAAHGLHPVAGQGFNLGLRDVAALAEVIADAADPGDASGLRRYADWRRDDHRRAIGLTDGLIRLFTASSVPVQLARSAGLVALDLLPMPRAVLARQTMGLAGRLPRLARGLPLR